MYLKTNNCILIVVVLITSTDAKEIILTPKNGDDKDRIIGVNIVESFEKTRTIYKIR